MSEEKEQRFQAYVENAKKERGYLPASMVYAARHDIDFIEAYDRVYATTMNDGQELPAKYRELVCAGVLAFRGFDAAVLEHVRRAIRLGATKREVLDAFESTLIPGGWPTVSAGLRALLKIEEEEQAQQAKGAA